MKSLGGFVRVGVVSVLAALCGATRADQALVRHAPVLNGNIDGSVQQVLAEGTTLNGGATVTGDLLVPGSPTVSLNGHPNYAGTLDGTGSTSPSNYQVILNGNASLRHVVRRTDAVALPVVGAPGTPTGSTTVAINAANQLVNWSSVRNLTLNGNVGQYVVPAGSYGDFTANSGGGFTLGVAGASQPSVYNFQHLTFNGNTQLQVLGPVILNLANGFSANGSLGGSAHPAWLTLNIQNGGLTLNGGAALYGYVVAPNGSIVINGNSLLVGGAICDRLTVNGNGTLRLQASVSINQPPAVALTAPAAGSSFTAPASFVLSASATDSDGYVTLVEFFEGTIKLGQSTAAPWSLALNAVGVGAPSYYARATDNLGASTDSATVTVTVTNPNQPPSVALTAPVDGAAFTAPATIDLVAAATDIDGTVAKVEFYQVGTKIGEDLTAPFQQSTAALSAGTYELSAIAYDNLGATATSTKVTITVLNPNQPPTVAITAPLDGTSLDDPANFVLKATAADADGTIVKVEFFQNGVRLGETTTAPYEFSINALPVGTYDFVARVTDNAGSSTDSTSVRLTVAHVNDAPVATPQTLTILEDTQAAITLTGSDPDHDAITFAIVTPPGHGALTLVTPTTYSYLPAPDFNGIDSFTFKASDGVLESAPALVQIAVTPRNDPPVAQDQAVNLPEDSSATILLKASDVDSPSLTFVIQSNVSHGTLSGTMPNLTYTPDLNYHGTDSFTFKANDGLLDSNLATVSITVTPVNHLPVAAAQTLTGNAGSTLPITLTGSDADGDALTYAIVSGPSLGTLSGTAPALTYTPTPGFSGTDGFTFTVSDPYGASAPATVTIQVQAPVVPPTAQAAQGEVQVNSSLPFVLHGSDAAGLPLTFTITTPPTLGSVQLVSTSGQSSQWTYTAGATVGVDTFAFTVSNGLQISSPAAIKIRVIPAPPVVDAGAGKAGGIVRDAATLQPLEGAIVRVRDIPGAILSGEDGQFMIPVIQFGAETAKMIVLEYAAPGYITAYRRVIAYPDVPVTTDPVFLKKYDSKITTIGSAGGTATNAAGDVQVDFPAGAVGGSLPVQLTNYSFGRELPGHLPKSSAFTYAVDLAPNGATFSSPVTVKIANVLGFAPNTPVPVGVFNPQTVRWEPESMGTISADGQWVVCQVTHFSTRDCNHPPWKPGMPDGGGAGGGGGGGPDKKPEDEQRDPGISVARGTYEADIDLLPYRSMGSERAIKLRYESEAATGHRPFTVQAINNFNTSSPLARAFNIDIGGHNYQTTFKGESANEYGVPYFGGAFLDLHDLPTGLYPYKIAISNLYASTYATASSFGGPPEGDTGVPAREAIPYSAIITGWLPWVNASDSPYGSGWSVEGISRLYTSNGSEEVMRVSGSGDWAVFKAKTGLYTTALQAGVFQRGSLFSIRKDYAGGLLIAHGDGVSRMAPDRQITPVISGVSAQRYGDIGSGSISLMPGGIVDVAKAESGSIYIITRIDIADPSSTMQATGLYRFDPSAAGFTTIATDLVLPTEVQLDAQSRIYVYDAATGSIWRYCASNGRELMVANINGFYGMAFDEGANRLVFSSGSGGLQYLSDQGIVANVVPDGGEAIYYQSRPVVLSDGEIQVRSGGLIYRYRRDGTLIKAVPTDVYAQRWEASTLGDFWFIDDTINLGDGGGPAPQLAANADLSRSAATMAFVPALSYDQVALVKVVQYDPAVDATKLFVSNGPRPETIVQSATGWAHDDLVGTLRHYSLNGLLLDEQDRNGNTTVYSYDTQNRLTKITDPVGLVTAFTYNATGKLAHIDDPAGRRTLFAFDALGNLTGVTLPDGARQSYSYDSEHNITKKTDALAHDSTFSVGVTGVYSKITYADGTSTGFDAQRPKALGVSDPIPGVNRGYDTGLPSPVSAEKTDKMTDSLGHRSGWMLDERGYPVTSTDALGYTTTTVRDNCDRLIMQVDKRGFSTTMNYDEAGNLVSVTEKNGAVTAFYYDPLLNLPTQVVDPRGNSTIFEYDTVGNLTKRTDALGNGTTYTYNSRGQALTRTNALGETTHWNYDLKGNIQSIIDPAGSVTTLTNDSAGRINSITDPLGHTTTLMYDAANRILSSTTADGAITSFTYDANGNLARDRQILGVRTGLMAQKMPNFGRFGILGTVKMAQTRNVTLTLAQFQGVRLVSDSLRIWNELSCQSCTDGQNWTPSEVDPETRPRRIG